jgi:hypothetical protein
LKRASWNRPLGLFKQEDEDTRNPACADPEECLLRARLDHEAVSACLQNVPECVCASVAALVKQCEVRSENRFPPNSCSLASSRSVSPAPPDFPRVNRFLAVADARHSLPSDSRRPPSPSTLSEQGKLSLHESNHLDCRFSLAVFEGRVPTVFFWFREYDANR